MAVHLLREMGTGPESLGPLYTGPTEATQTGASSRHTAVSWRWRRVGGNVPHSPTLHDLEGAHQGFIWLI